MNTIFALTLAIVLVIVYSEIENRKQKRMEQKKRPCEFTSRKWMVNPKENPDGSGKFVETQKTGLFHRWGNDIEFGSENEPCQITVGIVEDPEGNVHTVNPNEIKFIDK